MTKKSFSPRVLALVAALMLLFAGLPSAPATATHDVLYVNASSGSDSATGQSPSSPLRTIKESVRRMADDGGTIVVMTTHPIPLNMTEPAHSGQITITNTIGSTTYPGALEFQGAFREYNLSGPTTFTNIEVRASEWAIFAANFHPITFNQGVVTVNPVSPSVRRVFVLGGHHAPTSGDTLLSADSHITIRSGTFYKVVGFTRAMGNGTRTYTGTSHIDISGGDIAHVFGASIENHYSGSTDISVTGGVVGALHTAGDGSRYLLGSAALSLTGGTVGTIDVNNVVEDVDLTLAGTAFTTIQASNASSKWTVNEAIREAAGVRTVEYAAQYYTAAQVAAVRSIFDEAANIGRVYVSAGGSGSACTQAAPCASLSAAVAQLASDGGTVEVSGSVPWNVSAATLDAGLGRVVLSGVSSAQLTFASSTTLHTSRDLTFENLTLANAGDLVLQADGSSLEIGSGVTTSNPSATQLMGVSDGAEVVVGSGQFQKVTGISGLSADFTGSTSVTVSGGTVTELWAGTDQSAYDVATSLLTVSGGTVTTLHASAARTTESLTARFLGGTVTTLHLDDVDADAHVRLGTTSVGSVTTAGWAPSSSATRSLIELPGADAGTIAAIETAFTEITQDRYLYFARGGTGDGLSPQNPLGTLSAAGSALGGPGHVVLVGNYTIRNDSTMAAHAYPIELTSHDGDIDFRTNGANMSIEAAFRLGGELAIDRITLRSPTISGAVYGMGLPLTIGADVQTELSRRGDTYLSLVGGRHDTLAAPAITLSVASGHWNGLRGGSDATGAVTTAIQTDVEITDGVFDGPVALAHRGEGSGSIVADVSGGVFRAGLYAVLEEDGSAYAADYDVDLTITGGDFWGMIAPARSRTTDLSGSFDVEVTGGTFGHLTDLSGSDDYAGDMTSSLTVGPAVDLNAQPTGNVTFTNTLREAADPYMFTHDGQYYFLSTAGSTMRLHKVANPSDLPYSIGSVIFAPSNLENLWSPEIHFLSAADVGAANEGWYLYLSASDPNDPAAAGQRQYVLKALDGDDLLGRWGNPVTGQVNVPERIVNADNPDFNVDEFVAGISIMRVAGDTYITYVAEEGRGTSAFHQTINLSAMDNPWTLSGTPSVITQSEYAWEEVGYGQSINNPDLWWPKVVEGATAVYGDNGEVFMAYSASGYWTTAYAIGYLRYTGGDPFDPANWVKNPTPIMSKNEYVISTGTGPTFTDHDGNDWFTYQARPGTNRGAAREAFIEPYVASGTTLSIGNGTGHPAPLSTEYTMTINPIALADKISAFVP
ncbi:family 43 glycosylhydrolase [Ruania alkalisoli]|uniref:Family 43 glycosylhydrolase n=1 Tax=Ruania alkalisoli TaxID=2779775 RepID=A0A7M1SR50_9MICO|nr:family 43 glycosylhydrolase [Ruania alkalisoli]QOR70069.1 family 43 glycosylhydrolase [Ruania alkalisoli]